MKLTISAIFILASAFAMAQDCCADKKLEAKHVATPVAKQDACCAEKKLEAKHVAAPVAKQDACCDEKAAGAKKTYAQVKANTCGMKMDADAEFMAEAHKMMLAAEGKDACCKSTATHAIAKGDKGCCNEVGQPAKFKLYVAGAGYKYFGCEGSAGKDRAALVAKGKKVGKIQKVASKSTSMR